MRYTRIESNIGTSTGSANLLSCHAVADYFLLKIDIQSGDTISNLKLQKLCYYAQAWHLALYGMPLFSDVIEAWAHGPAIPTLYRRFRTYRWGAIDPQDLRTAPLEELADDDTAFLDNVWEIYGRYSGRQLEIMTHREMPWRSAYGDRLRGEGCTEEITHESMREFYGKKAKKTAV